MITVLLTAEDTGAATHQKELFKFFTKQNKVKVTFICNDEIACSLKHKSTPTAKLIKVSDFLDHAFDLNTLDTFMQSLQADIVISGLFNHKTGLDYRIIKYATMNRIRNFILADDIGFSEWNNASFNPPILATNHYIYENAESLNLECHLIDAPKYLNIKFTELNERKLKNKKKLGGSDTTKIITFFAQPSFITGYQDNLIKIFKSIKNLIDGVPQEILFIIRPHPSEINTNNLQYSLNVSKLDALLVNESIDYWDLLAISDIALSVSSTSLIDWIVVKSNLSKKFPKPIYFMDEPCQIWHKEKLLLPWAVDKNLAHLVHSQVNLNKLIRSILCEKSKPLEAHLIKRWIPQKEPDAAHFWEILNDEIH